ncbi:MAG: hypothetical protein C0598_12730 [Marinilabiliales bacterium]|nr:MAG: hypothetical protein C0598_12730 [Marinilabiliales bacterium]
MEDENFKKDLDELFRLFNKLIKDRPIEDVPGLNQGMLKQFEFFFSNYENMKDQISQQLQGQFGEPVKEMVKGLIQQLKDELGEDDFLDTIEEEDDLILEDEIKKIEGKTEREKIDELLKTPGLTEEQIDELLDRRSNL